MSPEFRASGGRARRPRVKGWLRYSLRGLFVISIVLGVGLASLVRLHEQAAARQNFANTLVKFDTYYKTQTMFGDAWGKSYFHFKEIYPDPWHGRSMLDREAISELQGVDLSRLSHLSLANNKQLRNEDLGFLSRLRSLKKLNLSWSGISDEAVPHLGRLESLTDLNIEGSRITRKGYERLRRTLPNCKIAH